MPERFETQIDVITGFGHFTADLDQPVYPSGGVPEVDGETVRALLGRERVSGDVVAVRQQTAELNRAVADA